MGRALPWRRRRGYAHPIGEGCAAGAYAGCQGDGEPGALPAHAHQDAASEHAHADPKDPHAHSDTGASDPHQDADPGAHADAHQDADPVA